VERSRGTRGQRAEEKRKPAFFLQIYRTGHDKRAPPDDADFFLGGVTDGTASCSLSLRLGESPSLQGGRWGGGGAGGVEGDVAEVGVGVAGAGVEADAVGGGGVAL
jgi:hypothetical protein